MCFNSSEMYIYRRIIKGKLNQNIPLISFDLDFLNFSVTHKSEKRATTIFQLSSLISSRLVFVSVSLGNTFLSQPAPSVSINSYLSLSLPTKSATSKFRVPNFSLSLSLGYTAGQGLSLKKSQTSRSCVKFHEPKPPNLSALSPRTNTLCKPSPTSATHNHFPGVSDFSRLRFLGLNTNASREAR